NAQAALGRGQQRHAAGLAQLQGRARILVDERLLDRRLQRLEARDHGDQALVKLAQTVGELALTVRCDEAARYIDEAHAVGLHEAPAGPPEAWIDADDANRLRAHGP